MSLLIWLPLNGDLTQQGLSNVTVTNNGATVDNNGKIGKCYSFGSAKRITVSQPANLSTAAASLSCWVNLSTWGTSYDSLVNLSTGTGWNDTRLAFVRNNTANRIGFCIANGSTFNITVMTSDLPLNTWTHLTGTFDGSTIKIYVNGVLNNSTTTTFNSIVYSNAVLNIGSWSNSNNYPINGKLNDVRVYNHALSAKEVKELAKGLVLHYRLAGPGQENLIKDSQLPIFDYGGGGAWCTFTKSIVEDNGLCCRFDCTATGVGGRYYYPYGIDITTWAGQVFTWSFEAKANRNIIFQAGHERGGVTAITVTPQWTTFSKTWTFTSSGNYAFVMYPDINISVGDWFEIRNIKIEKGSVATPWCPNPADALYNTMGYNNNIEYDCSGYSRNGTKSGSITWDVDSPRYTTSYKFNTGSDYIKTNFSATMNELSISFWVKPSSSNGGYSIICSNYNNPSGGLWLATNCEGCSVWAYRYAYMNVSGSLANNVWHHCVYTFKNGVSKWYVNGEEKTLTQNTYTGTTMPITDLTIGNSYTGTSWSTKRYGNLSDFRLYCTALSAEDIAELYHSAVIVDNTGKTYAYEYFEAN